MLLPQALRAASNKGSSGLTVNYLFGSTSSSKTSHTFSGVAIGTASSTRRVVVVIYGSGSSNFTTSSVTINGSAATENTKITSVYVQAVYSSVVTTGTTATIVVDFTGAMSARIHVYTIDGKASSLRSATNDSFSGTSGSTSTSTIPAIVTGDVLIVGAVTVTNADPFTQNPTLSSGGTLVANFDAGSGIAQPRLVRSSCLITSSQTSPTVSFTKSGTVVRRMVSVVYQEQN